MITRSQSVSDARWSPSGARIAWLLTGDGRSDVVVAPSDGSAPPAVVTAECGAGDGYCWASDEELVVASAEAKLTRVHADGGVMAVLTHEGEASAPAVSARGEIACTIETDETSDVAIVPLDGEQWPQRVSHASWAWDPTWSPDGTELVWHEWTAPDMPWDASRIVARDADGKTRVVADAPGCGQPRFSPDGARLAYIREHQLWVDAAPVLEEAFEHAEPTWGGSQRSYAWSPQSDELAWCRNEDGFGRLVIGAPDRKSARELSKGWHRGIDWGANGIVCTRSGAVTPPEIVVLAPNGSARQQIACGAVGGFERTGLVEPKAVTWRSSSANVHGLLWRPNVPRSTPPPLLVWVHGGPTSQAIADWNARLQYFLQQGWAVLQPNYRGSTGYGGDYRRALEGRWGERDAADVAAGIRHATKEGWGDADAVVLIGGSAGGLTILNVAARHPDLVAAVVALYPVTDLLALDATTYRFESGYTSRLVGALPEARATYIANSTAPIAHHIKAPVLLMHGSKDDVVPPAQSAELEATLQRVGTPVERHVYEGESHGWRRAATVTDELDRITSFLARRVG